MTPTVAHLANQVRGRAAELEEEIIDRITVLEGSVRVATPIDLAGSRKLIGPTLQYAFACIELGERDKPSIPPVVISHARHAAWNAIPLHILLSRYFTSYSIFRDAVIKEYNSGGFRKGLELRKLTALADSAFERLIQAVGSEYEEEDQRRLRSSNTRHLERIKELLEGEAVDPPDLKYPFVATHVGLVAVGEDSQSVVQELRRSLEGNLLHVQASLNQLWAWIGTGQHPSASDLGSLIAQHLTPSVRLSVGEPSQGLRGWRITHRQAMAALPVALRADSQFAHYSSVSLLASALQDDLLLASLERSYLDPLKSERDGGETLRQTLHAYFSSDRNTSSAAVLLGVKRHTVTNRLRVIEKRLGRNLGSCTTELELALKLAAYSPSSSSQHL